MYGICSNKDNTSGAAGRPVCFLSSAPTASFHPVVPARGPFQDWEHPAKDHLQTTRTIPTRPCPSLEPLHPRKKCHERIEQLARRARGVELVRDPERRIQQLVV